MQLDVHNTEGKVVRSIDVPDGIFGVEMNEAVLHTVVKAFLANQRQGTHSTKTKSFVSGGGKKPFKQKGTGNARQGSSRSPLNPGGGTAHGPLPRSYRQQVNRNVKQLALKVALSDKARFKKLIVLEDFGVTGYSTKQVSQTLANLKAPSAILSDERKDNYLYRSARNIHKVEAVGPMDLNAHNVLGHDAVVISENALKTLQQRFEENK